MPQFERRLYEPSDDMQAFDSDEDMEDEGSRLPLLIGIALIVLLSFAGVVWLAYTQGVQRGRADAPQIVAVQNDRNLASNDQKPTPYSKLKIYQAPKADEDVASEDPAPPAKSVTPPKLGTSAAPPPQASPTLPAPNAPSLPPTKSDAASASKTQAPATGAPRVITPATAHPKPVTPAPPPAKAPAASPRAASATPQPNATQANAVSKSKSAAVKLTASKSVAAPSRDATSLLSPAEQRAAKFVASRPASSQPTTNAAAPAATTAAPAVANAALATTNAGPAATTAALPTATTPKAGGGSFLLQIGSYKSDAEANASWQTYKGAHAAVAGYSSDVRKAELGAKGTWYRLRIGPFASLSEANAACAKLKAQGGNCFPAKQ